MIELAVWDFNGTILADTRACMEADNHVIETFGGTPVGIKEYRETIVIPAIDFYVQHGCDRGELERNMERAGKVFLDFYEPRASKCRTRKGVKAVLEWLKKNSVNSIILSNHISEGIANQLKRLGIEDYMSHVLASSTPDGPIKERIKLERLRDFMRSEGYDPCDAFIVGDSTEEVEIGKALGITTVAVGGGYYAFSRLKASEPDYLVSAPTKLIGILESL